MATDTNFETFSYNPFSVEANLIGNPQNSDINFYRDDVASFDSTYCRPEEIDKSFEDFLPLDCLVHLNRSLTKILDFLEIFFLEK